MLKTSLVLGALTTSAAFAQTTTPASDSAAPPAAAASAASKVELDAVVVTSQKRKEDIRKVPLSVSAITGEALQDAHINDFTDLTRNVPNVSFTTQAGAGLGTIEIRGISSQAGSATVSVYMDDVSLTTRNLYSQGTAEPRFFDVDRIEVLRGPQGTLYGASSLGGTIRFISNQPDAKRFSGNVLGETSSTSHGGTNYLLQGVVNVPLVTDKVALRVGVQSGHDSGYIDQVDPNTLKVISKGINSSRWDVLKLALKAQIADGWSLLPALFVQRTKSDDIDASYLTVGDYQAGPNSGAPLPIFQTSKIVREPGKDTLTLPSLTVNGDLGFADLTGVLSGYNRRFHRVQDGTSVNSSYIGSVIADGDPDNGVAPNPTLGATVGALPSEVLLDNKVAQTSLELRLSSKDYSVTRSPITWVGGLFFSKTKTEVYDNEPVYGITAAFTGAGKDINNPADFAGAFPGDFPNDNSYYSARHYTEKQSSVFGELTYHFSDTLRGIAGLRYLKASQHFTREGDFYFAGGPTSTALDGSASATTPRFALDWDVTPETTLYANIAKGFRLGSANRPVPLSAAVLKDLADLKLPGTIPATFESDSLWSYELGSKSRLFDNRLSLNVAAFYIDWKNIQQDVILPVSGFDFETNVGRAHSYGAEFEARFRATEQLTVNASAGWTRAAFSEDVPALGSDDSGALHVRKGDPIQGVPNVSARLGFEYSFAATDTAQGFVRGSGQWTGSSHGTLIRGQTDYFRAPYFTADASAGVNFEKVQVALFVKNLTNTRTAIQQPSIQFVSEAYYLRPRKIGVTVTSDF